MKRCRCFLQLDVLQRAQILCGASRHLYLCFKKNLRSIRPFSVEIQLLIGGDLAYFDDIEEFPLLFPYKQRRKYKGNPSISYKQARSPPIRGCISAERGRIDLRFCFNKGLRADVFLHPSNFQRAATSLTIKNNDTFLKPPLSLVFQ